MKTRSTLTVLAAAALLSACASKVDLNEAPVENRTPAPATSPAATASGQPAAAAPLAAPQSRVATVDAAAAAAAAANAAGRIVYFDFDSFSVRDEFAPLIDAHGKALVVNRSKRLVVEGHADERGGREYNLALGQKRSEAVVRALALLGAQPNQLEAVSFGKERPAVEGSNEAAWAKNRRAELRDR